MKGLLKKTLLSGIAVLASTYFVFGTCKAAQYPQVAQTDFQMHHQAHTEGTKSIATIDLETQEEYQILQDYFKHKRFEGYEETHKLLQEFKELAKSQEELNKAYCAKDEKGLEKAGIKVTKKEDEINKKFGLNREHTGIAGIRKEISELEKGLKDVRRQEKAIKKTLEKRGVPAHYFDCYMHGKPLTLEKYSDIKQKVKENNFRKNMYKKFVRLEKILEYEDYIDETARKFGVDKKEMIEIWNQESELDISAIGKHDERGLPQFKPVTAELIAQGLRRDSEFKSLDYSFEKLSSDYKLNIIMTAAQLNATSKIFSQEIKETKLTFNQFYDWIREKGMTCTFSKIEEAGEDPEVFNLKLEWQDILKHYRIGPKRIREIQKIYRNNGLLKDAIMYIVHNGGGYAVKNIMADGFTSELLLYHLALYVKNLEPLYKIVQAHYGDFYSIVQKNRDSIERLEEGNSMNVWGINVTKHNIEKLQEYADAGLLNKSLDGRLKEEKQIVIADNYLLDDDMNVRCELNAYQMLVLNNFERIGGKYEQLREFKELEMLQAELNKAYYAKDEKGLEKAGIKVTKKEDEINKKFGLNREHTGMDVIRKDITELEKEITNAGFKPDLEAYKETLCFLQK